MKPPQTPLRENRLDLSFPSRTSLGRDVLWIASVALIYFATARLSLLLIVQPEGIAAVWPPAGIFLSALLLTRRSRRPYLVAVLLATDLSAELFAGTPFLVSAVYALALAGDAALGAWLLLRFVGDPIAFRKTRDVIGFLALVVMLSNGLMSFAAAAASELIPGSSFWNSWKWWAASDAIGNLLVTPFLLSWAFWAKTGSWTWNTKRALEAAALFILLALLNIVEFGYLPTANLFSLFLPYLTFPLLLWAALRFGMRGVTSALVILAAITIPFAVAGRVTGLPFHESPLDDVIIVQLYLAVMAIPSLLLAAVVTERRHVEEALRTAAQEWQATFDSVGDSIWMLDSDGRILRCNKASEKLFDLTCDYMLGRRCWEIVHGTTEPIPECPIVRMRETMRRETMEFSVGKRWLRIAVDPLFNAAGRLAGAVHIVSNITDRKRAEEALKESESKFRSVAEQSMVGISIIQDGALQYVNPKYAEMHNATVEEMTGSPYIEWIHPEDRSLVEETVRKRFTGEIGSSHYECRKIKKKGESFFVELYGVPTLYNNKIAVIGILMDITERKQAEEERQKLQGQFVQAQKMESVGRLAGGVAHDFNNMLGVILGRAELALDKLEAAHPLRPHLEEIQKAAQRSADLTRQLLAFARKQTVAPKVLDLNDTVTGMLMMLRRLIGEDIDLAWIPGADLRPVKIDPAQIDQMLANLCVNARDAIIGVGKITIETGNVTFDEAYCADHADAVPGAYVMLAVSDDGCGMDRDILDHLYEPFFTTKGLGQGTGLGLATAYGIVKQNEGFINVYSEPERGTTFKIYLPGCATGQVSTSAGKPAPATKGGMETILVVEDEDTLLELGKTLLEGLGYRVLTANTPGEAIELVGAHAQEIHLLITDVVLPEMSGRELSERIRQIRPDLRCLYMSGYTSNVIAHRGVLDEGVHFIQKPFSIQNLAAKVREALEQT